MPLEVHNLSDIQQIGYVWIRNLRFEIKEYYYKTKHKIYVKINNNYLSNMELLIKREKYDELIKLCSEAMNLIKIVDGNHYLIWLFYKLTLIVQSDIKIKEELF